MSMKSIIVCASALIFGLCGCDSGSNTGAVSGLATGPRTIDNALISVGVDKASLDKALGGNKETFYDECNLQLPGDLKEALTKAGLDNTEVKWAGVSVVDVEFVEDGSPKAEAPDLVVALAFDHDADKLFAVLKEEAAKDNSPSTKDATFLGEKGLVLGDGDLTIALASIANKLLVCATSEETAEKGVALYRDGQGGTAITMGGDTIVKAALASIGERIVKKMPAEQLEGALGPDVDSVAVFQGLKNADATITTTADNGVSIAVKLDAASGEDAAKIATTINDAIAGFRAMVTMMAAQDPNSKPLVEFLNSLSITADGATINGKAAISGESLNKLIANGME